MRKIDRLDIIEIKRKADQHITINTKVREGQAIFNAAYKKFPKSASNLRATSVDPYYDDDRINVFLESLTNMNAE